MRTTKGRTMAFSTLYRTTLLLTVSLFMAGCEVIGGIFRAGFWVGAIIILLIIGIIAWVIGRGRSAS
jgi:hypothetical protein